MAYKLLIVDDERDVVSLLKDYFELNHYETITAYSGTEAISKISRKPDLILLDVNMPDMDGTTVCEKIRKYVACPILFLTAKIEDSDKIKGFSICIPRTLDFTGVVGFGSAFVHNFYTGFVLFSHIAPLKRASNRRIFSNDTS